MAIGTALTQNGITQNGITQNYITQNWMTQNGLPAGRRLPQNGMH